MEVRFTCEKSNQNNGITDKGTRGKQQSIMSFAWTLIVQGQTGDGDDLQNT